MFLDRRTCAYKRTHTHTHTHADTDTDTHIHGYAHRCRRTGAINTRSHMNSRPHPCISLFSSSSPYLSLSPFIAPPFLSQPSLPAPSYPKDSLHFYFPRKSLHGVFSQIASCLLYEGQLIRSEGVRAWALVGAGGRMLIRWAFGGGRECADGRGGRGLISRRQHFASKSSSGVFPPRRKEKRHVGGLGEKACCSGFFF